ncbi:sphingolipid delta(4)-desaturase DES1-like [Watersipora subatra]|uniref:sphingolipid delta(4)-desaturase DES1-like n=1 Tax=Watersipora subatra TaxID=2589382 RepID=UPI00355AFDA8
MDSQARDDFEWVYTEEPHATRRKEILAKYPQIKKLFGPDPNMKWSVLMMVLTQIVAAYMIRDCSWFTVILTAYCFGGVINHSLSLATHEIAHCLAFGITRPVANRLLGIFANTVMAVPASVTFKRYHLDHHRYQGSEELDVDIPHKLEARLFKYTLGKLIWMSLQPFFYALRPLVVKPKPLTIHEVINAAVVVAFDVAVIQLLGWKSFVYLLGGTLLAMGIHPVAGHFISEHYMFKKGYETYSYYGPLNLITFNVGYHNEHHDFPYIPGSRLPQVRAIAPEYYDDLPSHTSWVRVLYDFITDPELSLYCRIKRKQIPKSLEDDE